MKLKTIVVALAAALSASAFAGGGDPAKHQPRAESGNGSLIQSQPQGSQYMTPAQQSASDVSPWQLSAALDTSSPEPSASSGSSSRESGSSSPEAIGSSGGSSASSGSSAEAATDHPMGSQKD